MESSIDGHFILGVDFDWVPLSSVSRSALPLFPCTACRGVARFRKSTFFSVPIPWFPLPSVPRQIPSHLSVAVRDM